jgi:hypothetical protein
MRVPQVSERVKELPAQALRGVFAGIGQLLLITDKLMNKTPAGQQVPQARGPVRAETVADAAAPAEKTVADRTTEKTAADATAAETPKAAPAEKAPQARDLDKTGNVRLLNGAGAGASGAAQAVETPVAVVTAEAPVAGDTQVNAEVSVAVEAPVAEEAAAPLPNYDELSVASLRARLRNLDAVQVKQMAEYERAHAARAGVIAMFERRIAKLEAGG